MSVLTYHERETIERTLDHDQLPHDQLQLLEHHYQLSQTASLIVDAGAVNIALQFPDSMLGDATAVAQQLRTLVTAAPESAPVRRNVYVLADTTFGSCCVDAVAAEHANADFIVHYGRCCLSRPAAKCPVLFVFEHASIDVDAAVAYFLEQFGADRSQAVLMLYDLAYHHAADAVASRLASAGFTGLIWPHIQTLYNMPGRTDPQDSVVEAAADAALTVREAQGRKFLLPASMQMSDLSLFYIGGESLTLTNLMMTHSLCKVVAAYDPSTGAGRIETGRVNKLLMRRYFMVQKARDADVVGIVVGTLGLAAYMPVIENIKRLVLANGKKPYLLAVGKPSPAKLGNFVEIDVFVLVACPENALLDTRDFLKPIVTPYELKVALDRNMEWDVAKYELDLVPVDRVLVAEIDRVMARAAKKQARRKRQDATGANHHHDSEGGDDSDPDDEEESDDEPHFSLVTGTYKQRKQYVTVVASDGPSTTTTTTTSPDGATLVVRNQETSLSQFVATSAAAEFLNQKRTYRGLETRLGETTIADVQDGRRGIARGYSHRTAVLSTLMARTLRTLLMLRMLPRRRPSPNDRMGLSVETPLLLPAR
ncbi:putative diphthamide synthesis protein-domain-containing protein [Entophlyctis helioformis]|nr:putative diphthamide synthesis protein-domain-containing protein [Entophlyctis helioformis]